MTRKEFLTALDQYLVTMSASEKADIISDYEEHFRVGLENGKTETEIAASLGSPYDVANQFLDGQKPRVPQSAPAPRPTATQPVYASGAARPATPQQSYAAGTARPAATQQPYTAGTARPTATQQPYAAGTARPAATQQPYATGTARPAASSQGYSAQMPAAQTNPYAQSAQQVYRPAANPNGIQNTPASSGYVDYDRQAEERKYSAPKADSKYNSTGIIILVVLCVVLIPTVGGTLVSLLVGLYGAVIGFATAGGSLIAVGAAFSAQNFWICLGLIFIGISFIALTGLLVMASIEGTKLFVKLIKYCIKEGKKLVTEGSF